MITPVAGIQHFVSLLDSIAGIPPHLPPLVIVVTSADGGETARKFLDGYHGRLSADGGEALVPHALGRGTLLLTVAEQSNPDVELLNKLAGQLSTTMPPGAGRRWRPIFFETCYDVITAQGIAIGLDRDMQRQLRDHLYNQWEQRTPWLAWIQNMTASPGVPGVLGLVATAVFSGPSRWWFGRRLNNGGWRWFGGRVNPATGLTGSFLSHALNLVPNEDGNDIGPLRRRILVDALIRDLDRLARRRRFLPHLRRRRWTPVLILDCTAKWELLCLDVVQSFIEVTQDKPTSPLLVIAAVEPDALESAAGTPNSVDHAVTQLKRYVNHTPAALTSRPWMPVQLTSEPISPTDRNWLAANRKVTPKIPGKVRAWALVAITAVIAIIATAVGTYKYVNRDCVNTWINSPLLRERVGLSDGKCEFTPLAQDPAGFPDLRELEGKIRANNTDVDRLKDPIGAPRDYRIVVFFAPLTRPENVAGRTVPANALWQLRGAIDAQKRLNLAATTDPSRVPIKLQLANSGDLFNDGPDVASVIAEQRRTGPGSVAAVIGISQSRDKARKSFEKIPDMPVIGASVTGSKMTDGEPNFFMVAAPNDAIAEKMVTWVHDHKSARKYTSAVIVYDPEDTYFSKDLHDILRIQLQREFLSPLADDIVLGERQSSQDTRSFAKKLCDYAMAGTLPVLTGRADQFRKLFTDGANEPACLDHKTTMLAGYGAVVAVASGQLNPYDWLNLAYPALANTAVETEEATGNDALLAASDAINNNAFVTGGNPTAKGMLNQLSGGFTVNGKTGTFTVTPQDHKDPRSGRIQILETKPKR